MIKYYFTKGKNPQVCHLDKIQKCFPISEEYMEVIQSEKRSFYYLKEKDQKQTLVDMGKQVEFERCLLIQFELIKDS